MAGPRHATPKTRHMRGDDGHPKCGCVLDTPRPSRFAEHNNPTDATCRRCLAMVQKEERDGADAMLAWLDAMPAAVPMRTADALLECAGAMPGMDEAWERREQAAMAAPRSKQDEARMRALRSLVLAGEDETARELAVRFGLELPSVAVALAA